MLKYSNYELFDGKIKPTKEELKALEEEFKVCQDNLADSFNWERAWCLFSFMLRTSLLKRLKRSGESKKDLEDIVIAGTTTFMNRYKNDKDYRIVYPVTAAYYVALKQLCRKPTLQEKFEERTFSLEHNIELLGDSISSFTDEMSNYSFCYNSFENDILDKLEREGY